jgi:predicted transposase/invertase (TIGR01784 family)
MTFIDPCNDWAFKRIFGSRESGPVLIGFLNDLLHRGQPVIQKVRILDPYLPSQVRTLKNTAVDVRAMLQDGSEVLIEMQMFPVAGFCQRVLYNGAKCLTSQLNRGSSYTNLRPVTVITLADCVLLPETKAWMSRFHLHDTAQDLAWPASGLELIFIELPKTNLQSLSHHEPLYHWLEFLKNAPLWSNIPKLMSNSAVRQALHLARHDSLSTSEARIMTRRQLYREDQKNMLRHALTQGRQQGMSQGIQQGRRELALDIASVLLSKGMSRSEVMETTGLSAAELNDITTGKTTKATKKPRKRAVKS